MSSTGRALCGREDFSFRRSSPAVAKAWMASRTGRGVRPRRRAIAVGVWPLALAGGV
jgi:hypothetical protein